MDYSETVYCSLVSTWTHRLGTGDCLCEPIGLGRRPVYMDPWVQVQGTCLCGPIGLDTEDYVC
jgi:hypothetical protein